MQRLPATIIPRLRGEHPLHTRPLDVELADMRRRTRAMFQQVFEG